MCACWLTICVDVCMYIYVWGGGGQPNDPEVDARGGTQLCVDICARLCACVSMVWRK